MLKEKIVGALLIAALFVVVSPAAVFASDLVVDTKFVADKLGKPDWVILDARTSEEYHDSHIPGAVDLGTRADKALRDPTHRAYTIVPAIEKTLGAAGIGSDKHVIIYGKAVDVFYTTVPFWALEYLGCNSEFLKCTVHYYDGGIERWLEEGGSVETTNTALPPAIFKAHVIAGRLATTEEVMETVKGRKKSVIIDARTEAEYNGSDIRALRGGHIPGATNIKVQKNYTADTFRMLPLSELASLYKEVPSTARVIAHCQTGTRSTYTYFVLRLLGYENVANYDDSWIVYGSNVNYPVDNEQWFDFLDVHLTMKAVKELQNK